MTDPVLMPQLGETVAEGKILTWFKSVGDEVKEGDNLFEVETDKVTIEVQAVVAGRVQEIRVGSGSVAKVGEVVAVIAGDDKAPALVRAESTAPRKAEAWRSPFEEVSTPKERFGPAKGPDGLRVTPLARRLIAQNNADISRLATEVRAKGSSRIDEQAVRAFLASSSSPAAVRAPSLPAAHVPAMERAVSAAGGTITLNTMRLKTGERLAESWRTIPHVFQAIEVDFSAIDRVRGQQKRAFKEAHGFSLTYLPFIARAACLAIEAFPQVNAHFNGTSLSLSSAVHLGIAVDLSHNGLVVPVVRDAGDLTVAGLAKAMRRLIDKARTGKLGLDDLTGGSYSISNNGAFGTTFTAPIINAPQVAILSTDAIQLKPAVVSTSEGAFIAPRMMGMVGQSFDHRAFDGAYSGAFLSRLKQLLETRNWEDEFVGKS
jgi:pyruvate/2-oxoglutarate dehydrogenase complex dihydrolipoamide acyltransferase (E2) component